MRAPAIALLALLGTAAPAAAHAFLADATPAVGSTVAAAPVAVAIHFTEQIEPAFSTVAVTDAAGHRVDDGSLHVAGDDASRVTAALKPAAPGTYTVEWHVTSVDTHRTEGRFTFTVALPAR